MDWQPETPRDRILAAAIDLIEREGLEGATTRSIAAAAGVNLAAINYYYRSKDALLEAAIEAAWTHARGDLEEFLEGEPWDPRRGLQTLAEFLLEGGLRFPTVSRATLLGRDGEPVPAVALSIQAFVREIAARVAAALRVPDDAALLRRTAALLSAIMFPGLAPRCLPGLSDSAERKRYAAALVADFLAAAGSDPSTELPHE